MKNFASFLTEATVGGGDTYRASTKIVEFLGKKLSQEYAARAPLCSAWHMN